MSSVLSIKKQDLVINLNQAHWFIANVYLRARHVVQMEQVFLDWMDQENTLEVPTSDQSTAFSKISRLKGIALRRFQAFYSVSIKVIPLGTRMTE